MAAEKTSNPMLRAPALEDEEEEFVPSQQMNGSPSCLPGIPCCVCVSSGHVGVLQEFGKYAGVVQPGCTCITCPCQSVSMVNMRMQQVT